MWFLQMESWLYMLEILQKISSIIFTICNTSLRMLKSMSILYPFFWTQKCYIILSLQQHPWAENSLSVIREVTGCLCQVLPVLGLFSFILPLYCYSCSPPSPGLFCFLPLYPTLSLSSVLSFPPSTTFLPQLFDSCSKIFEQLSNMSRQNVDFQAKP